VVYVSVAIDVGVAMAVDPLLIASTMAGMPSVVKGRAVIIKRRLCFSGDLPSVSSGDC